jgi:hypothetical protein
MQLRRVSRRGSAPAGAQAPARVFVNGNGGYINMDSYTLWRVCVTLQSHLAVFPF